MVVGPTNRNPAVRSAFASAVDSGVVAGTSAKLAGAGRSGGRWASTSSGNDGPPSRSASTARAFAIVASTGDIYATIHLGGPVDLGHAVIGPVNPASVLARISL